MIEDRLFVVTFHIGDGLERLPGNRQCLLLIAPDADAARELAGEVLKSPGTRIDSVRETKYAIVPELALDLPGTRPRLENL
jgi:hypothetical protein